MRKILLLALALGLTLGTTGPALADGAKKGGTVTYDINLKPAVSHVRSEPGHLRCPGFRQL